MVGKVNFREKSFEVTKCEARDDPKLEQPQAFVEAVRSSIAEPLVGKQA